MRSLNSLLHLVARQSTAAAATTPLPTTAGEASSIVLARSRRSFSRGSLMLRAVIEVVIGIAAKLALTGSTAVISATTQLAADLRVLPNKRIKMKRFQEMKRRTSESSSSRCWKRVISPSSSTRAMLTFSLWPMMVM